MRYMNMNIRHTQRAVAPIIATLLMVAISVVGGILIFVFAQGFFTDTSIQTPQIESLQIFGYDARDTASLTPHDGGTAITVSAAADGILDDDDGIIVYVRNQGAGPVVIEKIKIFGADYTVAQGVTTASAAAPVSQKFSISTDGTTTVTGEAVINAGQEASIIIRYEENTNGEIKIGRPIPVVIVTGNGATFTKQLQNGVQVG